LLYLVSDAFEKQVRVPIFHPDGEPILGMEHFISKSSILTVNGKAMSIAQWLTQNGCDWVKSPNQEPLGSPNAASAKHHGDFSSDEAVLLATIARIAGAESAKGFSVPMIARPRVNVLQRTLTRL
jgi:hypothetical protein